MTEEELIEALADKEHASWARWMDYLFSKCKRERDGSMTIPADYVRHWEREVSTPYAALSEAAKQSDRNEVAHILPIVRRYADTCQSIIRETVREEVARQLHMTSVRKVRDKQLY